MSLSEESQAYIQMHMHLSRRYRKAQNIPLSCIVPLTSVILSADYAFVWVFRTTVYQMEEPPPLETTIICKCITGVPVI